MKIHDFEIGDKCRRKTDNVWYTIVGFDTSKFCTYKDDWVMLHRVDNGVDFDAQEHFTNLTREL